MSFLPEAVGGTLGLFLAFWTISREKKKRPEPEYCAYRGGCNNIWVLCVNGLCDLHCKNQGCLCLADSCKT